MNPLSPASNTGAKYSIAKLLSHLLLAIHLCLPLTALPAAPPTAPPLMLANIYRPGINLADYWVSEKMDGVRGYWDGEKLLTRGGQQIIAPPWFTANWPKMALDGELWAGRGQFAHAVSTVRRQTPDDAAWRRMRFMVFDLPAHAGTFDQRLAMLKTTLAKRAIPWVQPVEQTKLSDHAALQRLLERTVKQGGEGLMLHRGASLYRAQRSDDLLKVKTHDDAEAKVIAHLPGKGKYLGMLGALRVETPSGLRFKLGTGFSDEQRRQPPPLGSQVTYRFRGLNPSGIPRFASFMRVVEQ
ncbi:DNA ligase [Collimonas sp.]|jgi:DNA ligase-1|uniref:DNA ligase n=1 Tax=Collimonas sp. TaxID=1963772 RepID=UPI002D0CC080|nr:DNA ligase [Collimonas sp.]HWW03724.1 DNA ligase [Collimonas sp.]